MANAPHVCEPDLILVAAIGCQTKAKVVCVFFYFVYLLCSLYTVAYILSRGHVTYAVCGIQYIVYVCTHVMPKHAYTLCYVHSTLCYVHSTLCYVHSTLCYVHSTVSECMPSLIMYAHTVCYVHSMWALFRTKCKYQLCNVYPWIYMCSLYTEHCILYSV